MSQEELNRINKALDNAYQGLDKFGNDNKFFLAEIKQLKAEKASLPPELLYQEKINKLKHSLYHALTQYLKYPDAPFHARAVNKYTKELRQLNFPEDGIRELTDLAEANIRDELQKITLDKLKHRVRAYKVKQFEANESQPHIDAQQIMDSTIKDIPQDIVDSIQNAIRYKLDVADIQSCIDGELFLSKEKTTKKLNRLTSLVKSHTSTLNFKASIDPSVSAPDDMVQLFTAWQSEPIEELTRSPEHQILRVIQDLEMYNIPQEDIHKAIRVGQDSASDA